MDCDSDRAAKTSFFLKSSFAMDYERIGKNSSQVGGFSPRKLRSMLLGVEKKRKEEDQESDSRITTGLSPDEFKDVNMVIPGPEYPAKEHNVAISRVRSLEEDENVCSGFEFHKGQRSSLAPPFSKPAPSKWDDAQKWIASPGSNRAGRTGGPPVRKIGSRPAAVTKLVVELNEDADTKRVDPSQIKREIVGEQKVATCGKDSYPVADCCTKPVIAVENFVSDSGFSLSRHDSSVTVQSATTFITPASTIMSVSMRDMGTEMTPIASQEPSRTGTPVRATTPMRSPSSSRPSTPGRNVPSSILIDRGDHRESLTGRELTEKELQLKTRREIMVLGAQLGKTNVAAWASKEEEEHDASTSLQNVQLGQQAGSVIQNRAAAWEEAEKAKYMARFKQEEIEIQAWENHQIAKTEAEMRKIEVEVERIKARSQEKLLEKLAATGRRAEEQRAAAEAKRNQQASRTTQQVEHIRITGHIPSSCFCWSCCF